MIQETFKKRDMPRITAIIAGFFGSCADDKEYTLEIKEKKKKRSLDANALAWAEMSEIAAKTGIEKTEVYRSYVKEIGGNSDILCIQNAAVEKFCENWRLQGIGWLTETMPSKLDGCTNVIVYYGSSTYDTKQMHRLIELIENDCKALGIPTYDELKLQQLIEQWEGDSDAES